MLEQLFYSGPSIGVLHEEYAKKGRIDETAPITSSYEVRIEAPVERVWELLSNPPDWETFDPDIHDVHLDSGVKASGWATFLRWPKRGKPFGSQPRSLTGMEASSARGRDRFSDGRVVLHGLGCCARALGFGARSAKRVQDPGPCVYQPQRRS
jgi:hypothetical protein